MRRVGSDPIERETYVTSSSNIIEESFVRASAVKLDTPCISSKSLPEEKSLFKEPWETGVDVPI